MATLNNKIDFAVILSVKRANPNGDPLDGNRPRIDYDGIGEISDVCIKRKIRNRLMQRYTELEDDDKKGQAVFVQSDDNKLDDYSSLRSRAVGVLGKDILKDGKKLFEKACNEWIDVRAFGQVFAYGGEKGDDEKKGEGVSVGVRGPVSIHPAFSISPVNDRVKSIQITKSVSGEGDGKKKASDTMGMKHRVNHGVYTFYGSINPQLATKTLFSDKDADAIKDSLKTLFVNDVSSARPDGSMSIHKVYWWKHKSNNGDYSSAKVHGSVEKRVKVRDDISEPKTIDDYCLPGELEINNELPGLKVEIIEGDVLNH